MHGKDGSCGASSCGAKDGANKAAMPKDGSEDGKKAAKKAGKDGSCGAADCGAKKKAPKATDKPVKPAKTAAGANSACGANSCG
jgi:hypothetical protein